MTGTTAALEASQVNQRLSWLVIERAIPNGRYSATAAFETSLAASNYCMYLRKIATNPGWDCTFLHRGDPRLAYRIAA